MLKLYFSLVGIIMIAIASLSFTLQSPAISAEWDCLANNGSWTWDMKYYDACYYYNDFQFIERGCKLDVPGNCLFWECDLEWEGCRTESPD